MLIRLRAYPSNREFAATLTPLANQWGWIQDEVAFEFACDPDEVGSTETDDGLDLVTVRGEAVARVERKAGWAAMGMVA